MAVFEALACFVVFLVILSAVYHGLAGRQRLRNFPLPPGPPCRPFLGNILEIPTTGAWDVFTYYEAIYGDIVYFRGLGNSILVLNSMEAISDLLDKRGNNYSHRPVFTVVGELMALGQSMPLLPYGEEWRAHRKLAHLALSPTAVKTYHAVQEKLAITLCNDLLHQPEEFFSLVRLISGRIILSVTYGLSVGSADDEYITHAEKTMDIIGEATVPGAFLCDFLPFLKHLPSWVPFQRKAIIGRKMINRLVTMPFERVKTDMLSGTARPSLARNLLTSERQDVINFDHRVKWTTGAMYGAGGETTYATVLTFIMAMALHPSKQARAQAEIDNVIGTGHMPTINDAQGLPYVRCIIKETMRWHPVLPLSIARRSHEDDIYRGFFIPKGTIVIPNVYHVAAAPNVKYDLRSFIPERFLDPDEHPLDPSDWAFGFGRRICPGRFLAENSVFIIIASILTAFTILPPEDEALIPKFTRNLVSYPEPFKCRIIPRSEGIVQLLKRRAELDEP